MHVIEAMNSQFTPNVREKKLNFRKMKDWLSSPSSIIGLYPKDSEGRGEVEEFIAEQYNRVYQANISEFMPQLMAFKCNGKLSAAIGIKCATDKPLFVEQYLDRPVEQEIASLVKEQQIKREDIIEVGNLAASWKGSSQLIFVLLPVILERAGYKWVILTATGLVERLIRKLCFKPVTLCDAEQSRVNNDGDIWGDY